MSGRGSTRYLDLIMALFVAVLLISNVASTKFVILGPFTFDGGTILFPVSYIFGDVLTEVYGYARARRVIWIGFGCTILAALTFAIVGALPAPASWTNGDAYAAILGQTPRIVLASVIGYLAGSFSNAVVLARLKLLTHGRWLWMRTIGSTLVGEGVDSLLFVLVAFAGIWPAGLLGSVVVSNYVFKSAVETLATPLTYAVVGALKRAEGEDHYDYATDFSPFRLAAPDDRR
jgi:queuosine precursor transporter